MRSMSPNEGHFQSLLDPLLATLPDKSLPDQMDAPAVSRSIPITWCSHTRTTVRIDTYKAAERLCVDAPDGTERVDA